VKPRTIADALLAKHGPRTAHWKVRGRTLRHLYVQPMLGHRDPTTSEVQRATFWIVVGQMIEKVGNSAGWA
jgi:hypothetical protein